MRLADPVEGRRARIEMVPLIDTIFLLLAFFLYAMLSMVIHRGLPVELAAAGSSEFGPRESVVITITRDDRLYVDNEPASLEALAAQVAARGGGSGERSVWISGDVEASLGLSLQVLDRLRAAGIEEVRFQTVEPAP